MEQGGGDVGQLGDPAADVGTRGVEANPRALAGPPFKTSSCCRRSLELSSFRIVDCFVGVCCAGVPCPRFGVALLVVFPTLLAPKVLLSGQGSNSGLFLYGYG